MADDTDELYVRAGLHEGSENDRFLGVRVFVTNPDGAELSEQDRAIASRYCDRIFEEIRYARIAADPATAKKRAQRKRELLDCFPDMVIYVEEIPNEYSSGPDHLDSPWLLVTTHRGRIKIGWRKSVIMIDWSDSGILARAEELFPNLDTTMGRRWIHAIGYCTARGHLEKLLNWKPPLSRLEQLIKDVRDTTPAE